MVRSALTYLTGTMADLVKPLGASYEAVRSWAQGRRTPPVTAAHKLVALLRQRSQDCTDAADALDQELKRGKGGAA